MKRAVMAVALAMLAACATRRQASPQPASGPASTAGQPQAMSSHGTAGWVGQEFAGRTTANGEIFDPMLMTAAHRTLPFGTLLDVRNPKTSQSVRVRVNDRGPYVGDRLIDLSYAAAQQIGLVDSGGGEVDMTVVKVGRGDREPPAPFPVNVQESTSVTAVPPAPAPMQPRVSPAPATVDNVQVTEQHGAVETRKQVAADGTSIVEVPMTSTPLPAPAPVQTPPVQRQAPVPAKPQPRPSVSRTGRFAVQVGAFSQEVNAKALQQKLKMIGQDSTIDHSSLYLVRIGPFDTRAQAASVRSHLEEKGISAIIITQ